MDMILICKRADESAPNDQLATTHGGQPAIPVVAARPRCMATGFVRGFCAVTAHAFSAALQGRMGT